MIEELKKDDIVKSGAYCSSYGKFVDEDCWRGCACYCRYREVMIDEVIGAEQGWKRNGYKDGKWKDMPSYRYKAKTIITEVANYD